MQKKPHHYRLIVCAIVAGSILFLAMFFHSYWVTFLPFPAWQTWKWVLYVIYLCSWIALAVTRRRVVVRQQKTDSFTILKVAGGFLVFSWAGVEATLGMLAITAKLMPQTNVLYCGVITEHSLPIESLWRRPHKISVRIPDYGNNRDMTLDYLRRNIDIDSARQGDAILISGESTMTGILVHNMIAVESCLDRKPVTRDQKVYNSKYFPYRN